VSPRSTSSRSPAPSRAARLLPTARGPIGVAFAQGPRGCLTANGLRPRWGDAVTAVRADGAAAVSELEGGDAVVAGVAPGAHSLTLGSGDQVWPTAVPSH
jgi:hypothetical protein